MANKLELTWYGKDEPIRIEPRILIENKALSNTAKDPDTENMLIHGDNLLALKALESRYAGKVKCIYIDPPYNTGAAFEHYDDNLEHSVWLNLMYRRLLILYNLLSDDGTLWISIDNTEGHYLKIICDEIFRRDNFIADVTYEKSNVSGLGQGGEIVNTGEKILIYRKKEVKFNEVLGAELLSLKTMKRYKKKLLDVGIRHFVEEFPAPSNGTPVRIYRHSNYIIESVSLRDFVNRESEIRQEYFDNFECIYRTYVVQQENEFQNSLMNRMGKNTLYSVEYIPSHGKHRGIPTTLYYHNAELCAWLKDTAYIQGNDIIKTTRLSNVWKNDDIPKANLGNEGGVTFPRSKKPERLLERIIKMATNPGDIVLDSFLGSGTTAAVAHKMGRRYIGVEMGEHAYTHCKVRLDAVIAGHDKTGISKSSEWKSGGGYRFYELAPSLINKDSFGEYIINIEYKSDMLAAAVALHEGFTYQPDNTVFWKQSTGNGNSYLFVTTRHLDGAYLDSIHATMTEEEYLIIACRSYDKGLEKVYGNIVIKKIPQMLLARCEFGKDDYNLNIVHPPVYDDVEAEVCDE